MVDKAIGIINLEKRDYGLTGCTPANPEQDQDLTKLREFHKLAELTQSRLVGGLFYKRFRAIFDQAGGTKGAMDELLVQILTRCSDFGGVKASSRDRRLFGDLSGVIAAVPGLLEEHKKLIRGRLKVTKPSPKPSSNPNPNPNPHPSPLEGGHSSAADARSP